MRFMHAVFAIGFSVESIGATLAQTPEGGIYCRTAMPPDIKAPITRILDAFENPIDVDDNIKRDLVLLSAQPDNFYCSSRRIEYEVIEYKDSFRGIASDVLSCTENACKTNLRKEALPRRSYKWKARTFIQSYCTNERNECLTEKPDVSGYSPWSLEKVFRNWGTWLPSFTVFADEYVSEAAVSLGERSQGQRAYSLDGVLMSYGSKPARTGGGHEVELLTRFKFDSPFVAGGFLRMHTKSTEDCARESVLVDSRGREIIAEKADTRKERLSSFEGAFPQDIAGLVSPAFRLFNDSTELQLRLRCRSAKPFEFSVDYFAIDAKWLQ